MRIEMPYGAGRLDAEIDWGRVLGTIDIADVPPMLDVPGETTRTLNEPIGLVGACAAEFRAGERVCIVVSDSFRSTGIDQALPALLEHLYAAGIGERNVFFVYATGTHRGPTPEEEAKILGPEVYARFQGRTFAHDPFDPEQLVSLGTTSRGTPVSINRRVHEADRVVVTGTVVLHYFGGFGGGRKSVVPGVAGVDSIAANHSLNLHPTKNTLNPAVRIGVLESNPVAEDMLEASRFQRVDFMLNTVLNRHGEIAGLFAGELEQAHVAACGFARGLYCSRITEQADIVVASAGSAKNYLQSHKALFNAYQAVKPNGRIVFLTEAKEGLGGNKLAKWLELGNRDAIIAELRRNAEINGQTALSTVEKSAISFFVTELSEEEVRVLGGRKAASLHEALEQAREEVGRAEPTLYLMPSAGYTVPMPV